MLSLALAAVSLANFIVADYKHVVATSSIEIEQKYQVFEVTAYTLREHETGKPKGHPAYGITASGERVQEGKTIACPPSMPFGTKVYMPYFDQEFECQDRGGAITEGKLDVYMERVEDALKFGRRELEVLVY